MGERSLVRFTLLVQAACGALLGLVGVQLAGPVDVLGAVAFATVGLLVLAAIAVSTLHLGAPRHAPWAVANWRRSWLSREIVLLGLLGAIVALGTLVALLSGPSADAGARTTVALLAAATGLILGGTMVRLYAVRTIPEWDARTTAARFGGSTLRLGAVVAGMVTTVAPDSGRVSAGQGAWLAVLVIGGLGLEALAGRLPRPAHAGRAGALLVRGVEPPADRAAAWWLVAGVVTAVAGIGVLVAGMPAPATAILVAALAVLAWAEVAFRARFYGLAPRRGRDVARPGRLGARWARPESR